MSHRLHKTLYIFLVLPCRASQTPRWLRWPCSWRSPWRCPWSWRCRASWGWCGPRCRCRTSPPTPAWSPSAWCQYPGSPSALHSASQSWSGLCWRLWPGPMSPLCNCNYQLDQVLNKWCRFNDCWNRVIRHRLQVSFLLKKIHICFRAINNYLISQKSEIWISEQLCRTYIWWFFEIFEIIMQLRICLNH